MGTACIDDFRGHSMKEIQHKSMDLSATLKPNLVTQNTGQR